MNIELTPAEGTKTLNSLNIKVMSDLLLFHDFQHIGLIYVARY